MGKKRKARKTVDGIPEDRMQIVSDIGDVALMTAALWEFSTDELRTACRRRPDISGEQISSWRPDMTGDRVHGIKLNVGKRGLIAALAQSLKICPAQVTLRTEQTSQISSRVGSCKRDREQSVGSCKRDSKQKTGNTQIGCAPRVMVALIRSLGPLWQEMVQWDTEFLEGIYPRFHDHDGLVMLAAQLKHWSVSFDESDNLDSQGTCRFFGFVALRRLGIIESNPDGPLVLGKTQGRFSFAEEPRDGGSVVLDDYLRLDFEILPHMTLLEISSNIKVKLQELPASQLMGGEYVCQYLVRSYVGA